MRHNHFLKLTTLALFAVWSIRAHHILALPVFVDESLHILRAQVVFQFSDAVSSFLPGKLLTYYYFAIFNPQNHNGLWLSRQAVALLAPLSAAICFAIVKSLTRSSWAGILVIILYAMSPFLIFFERMALADPFALTFALGLIWVSILFARKPRKFYAGCAGLLLGLALLAKLTALPLVMVPVLAIYFLTPRKTLRIPEYLSILRSQYANLVICYGVTFLLLLLPGLYMTYQEAAQLENKSVVVDNSLFIPENRSRPEQIHYNLQNYVEAAAHFMEPMQIMLIVALFAAMLRPRESGFIILIFMTILGFLVLVSAFPSTRYLILGFPLLLIVIGLGVDVLYRHMPEQFGIQTMILLFICGIGVWFAVFSAIFIWDAWQDPTRLQLGSQDEWEYFSHTSSGYGLREAAAYLSQTEQAILIEGNVGSCHSLRFYFPAKNTITLHCPNFPFYDNPALTTDETANRLQLPVYLLAEPTSELDFIELQSTLQAEYPRPHNGIPVYLYLNAIHEQP